MCNSEPTISTISTGPTIVNPEDSCLGQMAFAYLDAATGEMLGCPIEIAICDGKIEHGGIVIDESGNNIYFIMNNEKENTNILTKLNWNGLTFN